MAFPDSTTLSPAFIEDAPDWGQPVSVATTHRTEIITSRMGGEQRARKRQRPRYSIAYRLSALNIQEHSLRKAKSLKELGRPVCVPIWTAWLALTSMTTVDRAELTVALALKKFKVGSWAYFTQAGKVSTFRRIVAVGATFIDLHASDSFPVPPIPAFTAGARVYPCVLGMRVQSQAAATKMRLNSTDELVSVAEL